MQRIQAINQDVKLKLADRPTITYFKKVLSAYEQKIDATNAQLLLHMEMVTKTQKDQDYEIE